MLPVLFEEEPVLPFVLPEELPRVPDVDEPLFPEVPVLLLPEEEVLPLFEEDEGVFDLVDEVVPMLPLLDSEESEDWFLFSVAIEINFIWFVH